MAFYEDKLEEFRKFLNQRGYHVRVANAAVPGNAAAPVTVAFPSAVLGDKSLIALPDTHIGDGSAADIFLDNTPANVTRFTQTLRAINDFMDSEGQAAYLLQLGDWYDVWRAIGSDTDQSKFSRIENVAAYQQLLELDKTLGLAHLIGNHDASFTHALPDRRVADGNRFRFGFGLMGSNGRCFALHGHQTDDIAGAPNAESDERVVWLATLAAKYVTSEAVNLENFIDKQGSNAGAVLNWLGSLVGINRPDPVPSPRARILAPAGYTGSFVAREGVDTLVKIAVAACRQRYSSPAELELLVVGHSHKPCIGWAQHPDSKQPVIVVDAGSWVYGAAQVLFGAGNRVSVFDIVAN